MSLSIFFRSLNIDKSIPIHCFFNFIQLLTNLGEKIEILNYILRTTESALILLILEIQALSS